MTKDTLISMEQLESVLDYSPTAIIISALDSRELLYANKAAGFRTSPACRYGRMTCYQAFGRDCPCPGCPAHIEYISDISKQILLEQEFPGGIIMAAYYSDGTMKTAMWQNPLIWICCGPLWVKYCDAHWAWSGQEAGTMFMLWLKGI